MFYDLSMSTMCTVMSSIFPKEKRRWIETESQCYIVIDDRRQYAAYLKEEEMLRYATNHNANAMYRSPITTYRNPTYGKAIN